MRIIDGTVGAGRKIKAEITDCVRAVKERDPAAGTTLNILLTSAGVHAILAHRVAYALYKSNFKTLACIVAHLSRISTGIEIHPGARLGRGILIDHGTGVVIGETAEVGDRCTLYQGVTLGARGDLHEKKRHPTLGDGVLVGAGAIVLGNINIGDGAKIGAGAVVISSVGDGCVAVGVPAREMKNKNQLK